MQHSPQYRIRERRAPSTYDWFTPTRREKRQTDFVSPKSPTRHNVHSECIKGFIDTSRDYTPGRVNWIAKLSTSHAHFGKGRTGVLKYPRVGGTPITPQPNIVGDWGKCWNHLENNPVLCASEDTMACMMERGRKLEKGMSKKNMVCPEEAGGYIRKVPPGCRQITHNNTSGVLSRD